uniref:Kinase n=1 Tax=Solanum tuberosum TaxID=4113 RepID=M1BHS7_SOLTU
MYNNTDIKTTNRTNTAPPTAPSITMNRLWRLCFIGAKTVTCGVSIVGFLENSLHKDIVKERHRFPDDLQNRAKKISRETDMRSKKQKTF